MPRDPQTGSPAEGETLSHPDDDFVAGEGADPLRATVRREVYTVREEYARGGLGRILRAFDRRLGREVAIKEILPGSMAAGRFEREARLTARLQHPSIVPVYEAGAWPSGELFYAMKLVEGRTLKELIASKDTLAERLALVPNVLAVAEAVAYAHSRGVIHRDIKPSNVVVGPFGETMVIDWGLAKELVGRGDPDGEEPATATSPADTVLGTVMGTPAYMAPEQAAGGAVDARADVYALGGLLYHVLSGQAPYPGKPSDEPARVRDQPPTPLAALVPRAPRELLSIASKAMDRDPANRYADGRELADDLRRFQEGQVISAQTYSRWALLRRWIARRRVPVALALGLLVVLAVTLTLSVHRIISERNRAQGIAAAMILEQATSSLDRDPTEALAWLATYPEDGSDWGRAHEIAADAASRGIALHVLPHPQWVSQMAYSPDGELLATTCLDGKVRLFDREGRARVLGVHEDWADVALFSPDGRVLVTSDKSGLVALWDVRTAERRILAGHQARVQGAAFSPDGTQLLTLGHDRVMWWRVGTGEGKEITAGRQPAVWTADGRSVVFVERDGTLRSLDVATGQARRVGQVGSSAAPLIAAWPGGDAVVVAVSGGGVYWWDLATGESRLLFELGGDPADVVFTPRGDYLAAAGDRTIKLWNVQTREARDLLGNTEEVVKLAMSPDGRLLASGGFDRLVRLWEVASGEVRVLSGHRAAPKMFAFAPDGRLASVGVNDGEVRVWRADPLPGRALRGHTGELFDLAALADGRIVSAGLDGTLRLWEPGGDASPMTMLGAVPAAARALAASPDGKSVATLHHDGTLRLWDVATRSQRASVSVGASVAVAFAPDSRTVASLSKNDRLWLVDVASGEVRWTHPQGRKEEGWELVYSADGKYLVSTGWERPPQIWPVDSGPSRLLDMKRPFSKQGLAAAPGGSLVAVLDWTGTVGIWDVADGTRREAVHVERAQRSRFSPDGNQLAVAAEQSVFVWRRGLPDARLLARVFVWALAWTPDGTVLVGGGLGGRVYLWEPASGRTRILRVPSGGDVGALAITPDGKWLAAAASGDPDGRLWPLDVAGVPRDPKLLREWMRRATTAQVTPGHALATPSGP